MYQPIYRDRCGRTVQKPIPWWLRWLGYVPRYQTAPRTPPDSGEPGTTTQSQEPPKPTS